MNYSHSQKPNIKDYDKQSNARRQKKASNSDKNWKALDLRIPGGTNILELQMISNKGFLTEPHVSETFMDYRLIEDKFTDEEIQSFKEAFEFFDREGDGTMDTEDLGLALRSLGLLVTGKEVRDLKNKYDPEGHEALYLKDFLGCISDVSNKVDSPYIIRQSFSSLDKEGTGRIRVDEFEHVFRSMGDPLSKEEMNAILKDLDIYGDNHLRINDIINLMNFKFV